MTESQKELLAELLVQWEELLERGQDTPAAVLAKDHPNLIQELDRRIRVLRKTAWLDKPLDDDPPSEVQAQSHPHLPRTLGGRYRLDALVSEGGFAQVFRAYDLELQRTVAIKIPKQSKVESRDSFLTEARRVAQLKHDRIVPVYDVGLDGDTCFIVTEYLEGGSLAERIAKGPVSRGEAIRWVAEIADALEYAHKNGILHRDIKPANIVLDHQGVAKLTDFGIAQAATSSNSTSSLGTLRYMAPEQLEGKAADHRSDIYSLGVVLYEVTTGRIPYSSSEPNVLRKEIVLGKPSAWPSDIPADVRQICQKALSKSPHQRQASAAQFAAELRSVEPGRHGIMMWPWIAVLVAIPLIATSLFLPFRPSAPSRPSEDTLYADHPTNSASDFRYDIIGDTVKITGFMGSTTVVKIPETIEAKPVTVIGRDSFRNSRDFTAVILPRTTKTVEAGAFFNCSWLRHITIPEGVARIDDGAFAGCSLTEIVLPASVTHFSNATYQCPTLTSLRVDPANRVFQSVDGILYNKQCTVVLRCPEGRSQPVVLPPTVTQVGRMAFHHCVNISSVPLPASVTSIGQMAFYRCTGLENITIPAGVKKLEAQTFVDCPRLKSISLPSGLESIGDGVFWGCTGLSTITIPASVTSIHEKAFDNCPAKIEYAKAGADSD